METHTYCGIDFDSQPKVSIPGLKCQILTSCDFITVIYVDSVKQWIPDMVLDGFDYYYKGFTIFDKFGNIIYQLADKEIIYYCKKIRIRKL